MCAGSGDRVIPDGVAVEACAQIEHPFDNALATALRGRAAERGEYLIKSSCSRINGGLHFCQFVGIFHEPQFRGCACKLCIIEGTVAITSREFSEGRSTNRKLSGNLGEGRARPNPELTNLRVRKKLFAVASGTLTEVQGSFVCLARGVISTWIEHQHRSRFAVSTPPR